MGMTDMYEKRARALFIAWLVVATLPLVLLIGWASGFYGAPVGVYVSYKIGVHLRGLYLARHGIEPLPVEVAA